MVSGNVYDWLCYRKDSILTECDIFSRVIVILLLALIGACDLYNETTPFQTFGGLYAMTAPISGYKTASFYSQLEGKHWVGTFQYCFSFAFM